jgi:hypothetical protein
VNSFFFCPIRELTFLWPALAYALRAGDGPAQNWLTSRKHLKTG